MGLHADDWFQILPRSAAQIAATFWGDWNNQSAGGFYRPLIRVSFAAERLLWGSSPAGFHLTNGLIFMALLLAVYRSGVLLTGGNRPIAALATVLLLALHPLKNEALYWVSGRTDLMATFFVMLAVMLALEALNRDHLPVAGAASAALVGGLLSKEVAVSGCAILPSLALLLGRAPQGKALSRVQVQLVILPVALGLVYLMFRRIALGGLAGYEGTPRPLSEFFRSIGLGLSALWWPWQADGPAAFRPLLAIPGLAGAALLLLLLRTPRGPIAALGAMLLALAPLSFLTISPPDGTRALLLPLCFQVLALAGLVRGTGRPQTIAWAFPMALLSASLQADNLRILDQFAGSARENAEVIARAREVLAELPDGAVLVAPEPPPSQARRILDPGLALIMALLVDWQEQESSSYQPHGTSKDLRFYLELQSPQRTLLLAQELQPWMEAPHYLRYTPDGLEHWKLERLHAPAIWEADSGVPPPLAASLQPGEAVAWTAALASAPAAQPSIGLTGRNPLGAYWHPVEGGWAAWIAFLHNGATPTEATLLPGVAVEELEQLQFAAFTATFDH